MQCSFFTNKIGEPHRVALDISASRKLKLTLPPHERSPKSFRRIGSMTPHRLLHLRASKDCRPNFSSSTWTLSSHSSAGSQLERLERHCKRNSSKWSVRVRLRAASSAAFWQNVCAGAHMLAMKAQWCLLILAQEVLLSEHHDGQVQSASE